MNDQQQIRADALTEAQRKALETAVNVLNINWEHETANELWEAFTAPVSQPAAAPIDECELCHSSGYMDETLGGALPGVPDAPCMNGCKATEQTAPSPADGRATCTHQWTWADGKCADCGASTQQPTPTGGMTLGERIAHVGGRVTDGGTVEFGSAMALDALVQHVLRDTRAAASPADERATGMPEEVRDSLMDSRYLAGVTAGWNAANADDPNAALKKIHDAYSGYLKPLRDWQKAGRPGAHATPTSADQRAAKISDYLNAPGMWAQVYCCAVFVRGCPSDVARSAADAAVKEFGDTACKTVSVLAHTLDEVLRVN